MIIIIGFWLLTLKYSMRGAINNELKKGLIPEEIKESVQVIKDQAPAAVGNLDSGIGNFFEGQNGQSGESPFEEKPQNTETMKDFSSEELQIEVLPPSQ